MKNKKLKDLHYFLLFKNMGKTDMWEFFECFTAMLHMNVSIEQVGFAGSDQVAPMQAVLTLCYRWNLPPKLYSKSK